jgi:aminopeptidase
MEKWAKALVNFSVVVNPGQTVAISAGVAAEPLIRAVFREVVRAGGYPVVLPVFSGLSSVLMANGNDDQLGYLTPVERFIREKADVVITIMADTNTKSASSVDPARQRFFQQARAELFASFLRRDAEGTLDWTLTQYPTDGHAQDAGMSTEEYTDFVLTACKLDADDPVAAWRIQADEQDRLIEWLAGKSEIRVVGPGTDLTLSVAGRKWINADGRKNFPDGEIFTGPVETSANGHVSFSYPAVTAGREVSDIRLRFEEGKVVDASAGREEAYLISTLDTDPGARYLGEFAFGANFDIQRFTKNILFDEKIGGTVHMALGSTYSETGSRNTSAIHWDMICDLREGGQVDVDGQPFMRAGKYVV